MDVLYVVAKTPVAVIQQECGLYFVYKGTSAGSPEFGARLKPVSVESNRLIGVTDHSHYLLEQDELPPTMAALVLTPLEKTAIADDVKTRWETPVRHVLSAFPIAVAFVHHGADDSTATLSVNSLTQTTLSLDELYDRYHAVRFNGEKTEVTHINVFA
jgi:hypothetical protein